MSRRKTSPIWNLSSNELKNLVAKSNTYKDILTFFGFDSGNIATLKRRLREENINVDHIENNITSNLSNARIRTIEDLEKILVNPSSIHRSWLKTKLLRFGLLENKCYGDGCNITDVWLNKPISLDLDHIDGNSKNNTLENLRLLCPNCHRQTATFAARNRKKRYHCIDCGKEISKNSIRCIKCSSVESGVTRRKFDVTKSELTRLLSNNSMVEIGRMFGVSDNAIRKRAKKLNIL